jgi:hypothetical protein
VISIGVRQAVGDLAANQFMRCSGALSGNSMPSAEFAAAVQVEKASSSKGRPASSTARNALAAAVISNSAVARLRWAQANRKRVQDEQRVVAAHTEQRAAEQTELNQKVALMRSASVGRVEASRQHLLEDNRRHRQEEGRREQFALAEKARRLQALREEHQLMLQASFRTVTEEYEMSDFGKLSQRLTLAPGGRVRRAKSAGKRKTTPFTDDAFY